MKVKCIKNNGLKNYLTIGKTYEVININYFGNYIIIDDNCYHTSCPKRVFKTLSEIRNDKIDKLLK